jgi:hypothetical protein
VAAASHINATLLGQDKLNASCKLKILGAVDYQSGLKGPPIFIGKIPGWFCVADYFIASSSLE